MKTNLEDCLEKVSEKGLVVCVFANKDYIPILSFFNMYFSSAVNRKYLVIAFDEETFYYCGKKNYCTYYSPFHEPFGIKFMQHQMEIIKKIITLNYNVLVSDIDAIWLKDPIPYTLSSSSDIVFSPGTIQPQEAFEKWGNVLCCGYFLLMANERVLNFLESVQKRMIYEGDQPAINKELISRNLIWKNDTKLYELNFQKKKIIQSEDTRIGIADKISVALLPNRFFQRLAEKEDPLVFHPIAPKICVDKMEVFKENGFLLKSPIRIKNRYKKFLIIENLIKKIKKKNIKYFISLIKKRCK